MGVLYALGPAVYSASSLHLFNRSGFLVIGNRPRLNVEILFIRIILISMLVHSRRNPNLNYSAEVKRNDSEIHSY